jgi:hypothetical protein
MSYHIIDPIYHQGTSNTVFEIPIENQSVFDPDLVLVNVGSYISTANNTLNLQYPALTGVYASIKNMTLRLNEVPVEICRDVGHIQTVKNLSEANGAAANVHARTLRVLNSYEIENGKIDLKMFNMNSKLGASSDPLAATSCNGAISLANVFGCLNSMVASQPKQMFHSKYLTLRLEIEWNTDVTTFNLTAGTATDLVAANINALKITAFQPSLIVKKYTNADFVANITEQYNKGFSIDFSAWLSERANLADYTAGATIITPYRIKSCIGKVCTRAVVQTQYNFSPTTLYADGANNFSGARQWMLYGGNVCGNYYSTPNTPEAMKLFVNNLQFLPDQQCNTLAMKNLHRDMALGPSLQLLPHCDLVTADNAESPYMTAGVVDVHKVQSWYAFNIGVIPEDFQVEYSKTASANDFLYAYDTNKGLSQVQTWRFEYAKIMSIMGTDVMVSDAEPKKTV